VLHDGIPYDLIQGHIGLKCVQTANFCLLSPYAGNEKANCEL